MRRTIIYLVIIILIVALAGAAIAQGASLPPRGVVTVKIGDDTFASGIAIQKDGKILVSASSFVDNQGQSILLRRNADGSSDKTFGKAGMVSTGLPGLYIQSESMVLQEDGKAVLVGKAGPLTRDKWSGRTNYDFLIMRYNPDGQMDKGFNGSGWVNTDIDGEIDVAYALAVQKDRKTVVIGHTSKWNGYHFATLRYNEDGTLDRSFGKRGKVVTRVGSAREDSARAVAIRSDNKIIVAGGADDYPRYRRVMALAQYRPDGEIDKTFGTKGKVLKFFGKDEKKNQSSAEAIAIQTDGKLIVGVNIYTKGSSWVEGWLVRLNSDGSLDHTFGNGGSVAVNRCGYGRKAVGSVALQSDGKILFAGGAYNTVKRSFAIVVGRNNADGRPDTTFGSNGMNQVMVESFAAGRKIAIQQDGKIIVAGDVRKDAISQQSSRHPADLVFFRLNADGQLDKYFGSVVKK